MHLSIFSSVITGKTPAEVARKTREYGLRSVQFVPDEVNIGWGFDGNGAQGPFEVWADAYAREGIEICAVAGYINLLPRDLEERERNTELFASFLRRMKNIGVRYISTETGSLSPKGAWTPDPANQTPQAWDALLRITERLVDVAAQLDVVILYEPYVANVTETPERGVAFVREINSPHLRMMLDPTNWFPADLAHPELVDATIRRGFDAERGLYDLAHAKDVLPAKPGDELPGLPGPGKGILNYPLYLQLLLADGYNGPLIMEHLTEAQIPESIAFVQQQIDAAQAAAGAAVPAGQAGAGGAA